MTRDDKTHDDSESIPSSPSRSHFLQQAGLGVAGLTLGGALPSLLNPTGAHAALSFASGRLNVSYWTNLVPKK